LMRNGTEDFCKFFRLASGLVRLTKHIARG
jgi:hypothetical protein